MTSISTALYVVGIVCAVWVIYDVLVNNKRLPTVLKIIWVVLAVLFSIITAIVYSIIYKR